MLNNDKSQDSMDILHSPRRMWRQKIKERWEYKCAYCGSDSELTIDHIVPRCKGGPDFTKNVVCCCQSCNQDKGHTPWDEWYFSQEFFSMDNYTKINNWMKPDPPQNLFLYRPRRNNAS